MKLGELRKILDEMSALYGDDVMVRYKSPGFCSPNIVVKDYPPVSFRNYAIIHITAEHPARMPMQ